MKERSADFPLQQVEPHGDFTETLAVVLESVFAVKLPVDRSRRPQALELCL